MDFFLVLTGRILPGHTLDSVRQQLLDTLKMSPEQAQALLPPSMRVIKRDLPQSEANSLATRLIRAGLEIRIGRSDATVAAAIRSKTADLEKTADADKVAALPSPAPAAQPASVQTAKAAPQSVIADALQALRSLSGQPLKRSRPTPTYRVYLTLVTLCCLLIPLLYAGLVATVAGGLLWYVTHVHRYIEPTASFWVFMLVYGVGTLGGTILLLFLARPFFLVPAHKTPVQRLDLKREPQLQAIILQLCRAIDLHPPVAVHLSNDVNASVHFEKNWRGFFTGRKVLTLGLPLVAGLTSQQFIGVLAHEFGHFAQHFGMRCNFLVQRVNAWLEARAIARDPWDDRLQHWLHSETSWWPIRLAVWIGYRGIHLSRRLLRGCLWVSFRLSRSLSRQMELDADRYMTQVVGSAAFRDISLQVRRLEHAWQVVDQQNASTWRERRSLSDMPQAVALGVAKLSEETVRQIEAGLATESTRYWHTHPAGGERIKASEALRAPGFVHDTAPAAQLFEHFAEHCQKVTRAYYQTLRPDLPKDQVSDSQTVLALNEQRSQTVDNLAEWTGRQFRPLPWLSLHAPLEPGHAQLDLQEVIDTLRQRSPEISQAWDAASKQQALRSHLAGCYTLSRNRVSARVNDRETFEEERHLPLLQQIETGETKAQYYLADVASLYRRRLELSVPHAEASVCEAYRVLIHISSLYDDYATLLETRDVAQQMLALHRQQGSAVNERMSLDAAVQFQDVALRMLNKADSITQGFLDGETLGGYLRLRCPRLNAKAGDPLAFFKQNATLIDSLAYAHRRAFAEVANFCEQYEKSQSIRGIRIVCTPKAMA